MTPNCDLLHKIKPPYNDICSNYIKTTTLLSINPNISHTRQVKVLFFKYIYKIKTNTRNVVYSQWGHHLENKIFLIYVILESQEMKINVLLELMKSSLFSTTMNWIHCWRLMKDGKTRQRIYSIVIEHVLELCHKLILN